MRAHPTLCILLGTLASLGLALGSWLLFFYEGGPPAFRHGMALAIVAPLLTGGVIFLLLRPFLRELEDLRQHYAEAIAHDSLTSCLTGPVFSAMVDAHMAISPARAGEGGQGAFLVLDVDDLGALNSNAGHRAGDDALRIVGEVIRDSVRRGDIVGRLGGGEFGIFLPGATKENAEGVAERIRRRLSEVVFRPGTLDWTLSVSVGAVLFSDEIGFDDLTRTADGALRRAKERGRNSIEYAQIPPDAASSPSVLH